MPINREALGVLVGALTERRQQQQKLEDERRDFEQRLVEAGIRAGQLELEPTASLPQGIRRAAPFDPSTLSQGQTYSQRVGGGTLTSRWPTQTSEAEVQRLSLGLTPGRPMSLTPRPVEIGLHPTTGEPITRLGGGLPSTLGGTRLVNQLIAAGQTESPAAIARGGASVVPISPGSDLPNPAGMREGTIIEDDQTGQRYRLSRGQWQPI